MEGEAGIDQNGYSTSQAGYANQGNPSARGECSFARLRSLLTYAVHPSFTLAFQAPPRTSSPTTDSPPDCRPFRPRSVSNHR
jgi:hypothetical protein